MDSEQAHNDASVIQTYTTFRSYTFYPSQVFTQDTLTDIRSCIGLTEHNMTTHQFSRVLDDGMTVSLVLAVANDGFRYIKDVGDSDNGVWCGCHTNDGYVYTTRYSELTDAIQNILIDHINDGKLPRHSNMEFFLRYQMTLQDMDWDRRVRLGVATAGYITVLPSRKQVIDAYNDLYVRPATAKGDEEEDDE